MRNEYIHHIIRVIAGAYVVYMGFTILIRGILSGAMTGRSYTWGLIFSIFFIVAGTFLAMASIRAIIGIAKTQREQKDEEAEPVSEETAAPEPEPDAEEPKPEPEEKPAEKSLFDKAGMTPKGKK